LDLPGKWVTREFAGNGGETDLKEHLLTISSTYPNVRPAKQLPEQPGTTVALGQNGFPRATPFAYEEASS